MKLKYSHALHLNFVYSKERALGTAFWCLCLSWVQGWRNTSEMTNKSLSWHATIFSKPLLKHSPLMFLFCISDAITYSSTPFWLLSAATYTLACLHIKDTLREFMTDLPNCLPTVIKHPGPQALDSKVSCFKTNKLHFIVTPLIFLDYSKYWPKQFLWLFCMVRDTNDKNKAQHCKVFYAKYNKTHF